MPDDFLLHGLGLVDVARVDPVMVEGAVDILALKGVAARAVTCLHEEVALVEVADTITCWYVARSGHPSRGDDATS